MNAYPDFLTSWWTTLRSFSLMPPVVAQLEGAPVAHRSDLLLIAPDVASFPSLSHVPAL